MHVHTEPMEARRGCGSSGTGVQVAVNSSSRCWELNLGPLAKQQCS